MYVSLIANTIDFDKINYINSKMLLDLIRNVELLVLEFAKYSDFKLGKI
ncbi:hypothetical protein BG0226 [Borreliella bavariensis PBi]|uniref:Uncharacterized protein n=1 Tax=Borrelia garinii subsp. bavariensis (strain ATCC BAA-2496 / DSM 23469 / PBi) TaxID=290434 RepID=A0A7I6GVR8_BORGP|nr:hypothetical protein [Borreliella bavariensis]AAU07080.1 hypothetical protein BG0226 [Borreliella bavariensis PBi]